MRKRTETLEEFLARGGEVSVCPTRKANARSVTTVQDACNLILAQKDLDPNDRSYVYRQAQIQGSLQITDHRVSPRLYFLFINIKRRHQESVEKRKTRAPKTAWANFKINTRKTQRSPKIERVTKDENIKALIKHIIKGGTAATFKPKTVKAKRKELEQARTDHADYSERVAPAPCRLRFRHK